MRQSSELPVEELLHTVFNSILEVSIVCIAGFVLAGQGVLDKRMQKQLNRLNITLFTPCLLLSKVALSLSPSKIRELWIVPIFWAIITAVSMASAYALGIVFKLNRMHRNFAMAAAMFMNSNSLPVALMQSLVLSVQGLKWGPDDTGDAMVGRALSYLVIAYALGMVLRWSFGVRLLSLPASEISPRGETPLLVEPDYSDGLSEGEDGDMPLPSAHFTASSTYGRTPSGRTTGRYTLSHSLLGWAKHLLVSTHAALKDIMTPPLFAAIASILIALIPPLQNLFAHHMHPVKRAVSGAGNCSIPCTLLVLGAYFYELPEEPTKQPLQSQEEVQDLTTFSIEGQDSSSSSSNGSLFLTFKKLILPRQQTSIPRWMQADPDEVKPEKRDETKAVSIAILSRMLVAPLLLMPIIIWCARVRWQEVFEDPVFVVTNILLVSSPSAVTLAQLTSAASGDTFERLISRTIFWSYCIVTPPATIFYLVLGLSLARI